MLKQRRPLLWICLFLTSSGFMCNFIAFILPYWFARFPNAKNRFLRLGLWEICLHEYMPQDLGNIMYTGCFYLFDPHISALRPNFIRTWFLVCQIFYTLCFVCYVTVVVVLLSQAVNLISPRGPRAVLFCILTSGLTCVFLLITLTVMGAGVDSESRRKPVAEQDWLQALDQCGLSWSYGLAASSMPGSLLTFAILSCFVYPKRANHRLLSVTAWSWPSLADWTCLHNRSSSSRSASRSHSHQSRSATSGDARTHSALSERNPPRPTLTFRDPLVSATPSASYGHHKIHSASHNTTSGSRIASHGMYSTDEKPSSYDPRSPDSISLLSYESPYLRDGNRYSGNTSARAPSRRPPERVETYRGNASSNPDSRIYLDDHQSSATLSCRTPPKSSVTAQRTTTGGGNAGLRSTDTSVWTTNSLSVQAARPMRRERNRERPSSRSSSRQQTTSTSATEFAQETPTNNTHPPLRVQAAKKMKRKS